MTAPAVRTIATTTHGRYLVAAPDARDYADLGSVYSLLDT